jgi:hypothetical protein
MRITALTFIAMIEAASMAQAQPQIVNFEQDTAGQPPKGFVFGHTAKAGSPGKWIVQQEGTGKVLAQIDADRTRSRFPVAVLAEVSALDVDLSVRFRPVSGRVDQAAGLVWRYQDEDNYYLVRANALEENVVLYKVQNGRRTDLPVKGQGRTYGMTANVPTAQWSTLRVTARGSLFEVFLNGAKLYEVEDTTFAKAGKVGVWTKADSVTQFDDLSVTTK